MKLDNQKRNKKNLSLGFGTSTLLLINIALFIFLKIVPEIGESIFLNPRMDLIFAKPWTLITVFFAHENIIHIIGNMAVLVIFGKLLEEITSAKTVIIIYLITGFIGSLTFPPIAPVLQWTGPVMGASAAAFGIASAFGMMRPDYRFFEGKSKIYAALFGGTAKSFTAILFAINIIIFILNPTMSIGVAAHAAGIILGGICGYWLRIKEQKIK